MTKANLYNAPKTTITYPESDGLPMANNTEQFHLITTIKGNLEALFADDPQVFVAGNLFWYPVEGDNTIRQAPDVMVALGRPKRKRNAYLQWVEEAVAPQVVFEILSSNNRKQEMHEKFAFYDQYGVEEYYLYDPKRIRLEGWSRSEEGVLTSIAQMNDWCSPRLDIRFAISWSELELHYPDGSRFLSFVDLMRRVKYAEQRAIEAFLKLDEAETRAEQAEQRRRTERAARLAAEARTQEMEAKLRAAGLL